MIDTHTHIYDTAFGSPEGSCEAVDRAIAAGVDMMILPT